MKNYMISFLVSLLAGLGVWVLTKNWSILLIFISFAISLLALSYFVFSFRYVGIISWSRKRGFSHSFRKCLERAKLKVDFLASWGGSIPSLSPYIEETFKELVKDDYEFRFLLLKPGSYGVKKRKESRGTWPPGEPEASIRWLLNTKKSLGDLSNKFRVAVYSEIPVWAMVILDNEYGIIGFYGNGVGRHNPGITVKRIGHKPGFIEPFRAEYEKMWSNAQELHNPEDLDDILKQQEKEEKKGFVVAITGPSGIGKTTLCSLLTGKAIGMPSTTVTTRPAREQEVSPDQYEFTTEFEFEQISYNGKLLCEATFGNNRYGIKAEMVYSVIEAGKILILDTIIPSYTLKKILSNRVVTVFLSPSSIKELEDILKGHRFLTKKDIELRLKTGKEQMKESIYSDYILNVDRDLLSTLRDLEMIITSIKESYDSSGSFFPENLAHFRAATVIQENRVDINEE
jgi:guanylate kinase